MQPTISYRRRDHFVKVRYKDKRDVMSLAKKQKPWNQIKSKLLNNTSSSQSSTDGLYILKSIHKDHIGDEAVLDEMRSEIQTMSKLQHPNICRLIEAYERRRHIYLVMEFCSGGNLARRYPLEEGLACVVCKKILLAVEYIHSKGLAHRDIKLENIMLDGKGEIKLIDFGLATAYLSEDYKNMTDKVGTLYSMAPQVINGSYDEKCDLWSVGVVAYLLLSGEQPFWGPAKQKMPWKDRRLIMMDLIKNCQYAPMTTRSWKIVSNLAKEFVSSLLQFDPNDRPTASEAIRSPWIRTCSRGEGEEGMSDGLALDDDSKEKYEQITSLRRRLWQLLSTGLSEEEIEGLRAYVEAQNEEGDCLIRLKDLQDVLMEVCDSSDCCGRVDVEEAFAGCDNVKNAKINYVDFFIEVQVGRGRNTVEELAKRLDKLDISGTRKVSADELRSVVDDLIPSDMAEDVWNGIIVDEYGMVNTSDMLSNVTKRYAGRHRESIRSNDCRC